jgi:imidazolonepropionase-like amidohydrolase
VLYSATRSTLIRNAVLVDVDSGRALKAQDIAIRNGRFEDPAEAPHQQFDDVIDAGGAYACPGLIDAHVHLFLDASATPRSTFLSSDDATKLDTAATNAAQAIAAGITTVRDCGGPAALVFRFQKAIESGEIPGPRILASGSPLTRPQGHCHFFGIEVSSVRDVRTAVDTQAAAGAAFIKIIASGGGLTPGTDPTEADLPLDLMFEAVSAAHAHGLHVAAHCHAVESIERAIKARVDIIEHASFAQKNGGPKFDAALADRLRGEGIVVSPTAISGVRIAQAIRQAGGLKNGHDRGAVARLEARRDHVARFCESGVHIIAGTDCGVPNTPFDSLVDELDEYVKAGMSPGEALRAATSDSARYLNQPLLGAIREGLLADLLLLRENPLNDIYALKAPLLVMKGGEILLRSSECGKQLQSC